MTMRRRVFLGGVLSALAAAGGLSAGETARPFGDKVCLRGTLDHGHMLPFGVGCTGIGMMAGGLAHPHGESEVLATMIGNFQDGRTPGKIQFGSGWWFLDQKDGMEKQMNALSNMGLLSQFVGMLTDSRSFLSYPRHEYFRRILCNMIGTDVENGEVPDDIEHLGEMVQDICYNNAVRYFGVDVPK